MQNNKLSELINLIEEKSNVSDIISDYISLEKKGNNHVGLCPFHSDSNPSMSVSDQKKIFKCFVCGAAGGAISFVQNYQGVNFIEATKIVADKLKIDWRPYISQREVKINPEEKRGWEINNDALTFFKYSLQNTNEQRVNNYIKQRGIDSDIIDNFDIGYAFDGLSTFLLNKEYTEEEIIKYGLAKRREDTTLQDYFINRLIFTIRDANGNVIGFSGRIIDGNSKYVKYMNSPETPIFKKSNILYNLDKARIHGNLKKELIIVEGFMDVIALHKAGIDNSIATMGTAFTKQHNKKIKSITTNITLAFDSDVPGINATIAIGKSLLVDGFNVDVVEISSGKDFDELLKLGTSKVKETLENKVKFIHFYKNMIYRKLDQQGDNVSFDDLRSLLKLLTNVEDKMIASRIIIDISEKYKIDKKVIEDEYEKLTPSKISQPKLENEIKPPFIPDYIPNETEENKKLRDYAKNISKNDSRNTEKIKVLELERDLIGYALLYDYAFKKYIEWNPLILNELLSKFWREYVKALKLDEEIKDIKLMQMSSRLKEDLLAKINSYAINEVYDEETFENLLRKHEYELNEFNINNLKLEMNKVTDDIEEYTHMAKILKNLTNNKV